VATSYRVCIFIKNSSRNWRDARGILVSTTSAITKITKISKLDKQTGLSKNIKRQRLARLNDSAAQRYLSLRWHQASNVALDAS